MWKFLFVLPVVVEALSLKTGVALSASESFEDITKFLGIPDFTIPQECKKNLEEIAKKMREQSFLAKIYYSSWFWTIVAVVVAAPFLFRIIIPRWLRWTLYFGVFTASVITVIINVPLIRRPVLKMLQAQENKGNSLCANTT